MKNAKMVAVLTKPRDAETGWRSFRCVYDLGRVMAVSKVYENEREDFIMQGGVKLFRPDDFERTRGYWTTKDEVDPVCVPSDVVDEADVQLTYLVGLAAATLRGA